MEYPVINELPRLPLGNLTNVNNPNPHIYAVHCQGEAFSQVLDLSSNSSNLSDNDGFDMYDMDTGTTSSFSGGQLDTTEPRQLENLTPASVSRAATFASHPATYSNQRQNFVSATTTQAAPFASPATNSDAHLNTVQPPLFGNFVPAHNVIGSPAATTYATQLNSRQHIPVGNFVPVPTTQAASTVSSATTSAGRVNSSDATQNVNVAPGQSAPQAPAAIPAATPASTTPTALSREANILHPLLQNYDGEFIIDAHRYDREQLAECERTKSRLEVTPRFKPKDLARIVVKHELYKTRSYDIQPSTFQKYAEATVDYFEGEVLDRWFVVSHVDEDGNPVSAKGAYYEAYKYLRKKAREIKRPGASRLKKYWDELNGIEEVSNETPSAAVINAGAEVNIDYDFIKEWTKDALARYEKNERRTMDVQYKKKSEYAKPSGWKLIIADYAKRFPGTQNNLTSKWPEVSKLIIQLAEKHRANAWIDSVLTKHANITSNDYRQHVALLLLPALIQFYMKGKKAVGDWRPSPTDVTNSFILQVDDLSQLKTKQEEFHTFMANKKVPVQPYVLICGPLDKVEAQYAVVNKINYSVSTPMEAVDVCFKSCAFMRTSFTRLSEHSWKYLSSYIYQIPTRGVIAAVSSLEYYLNAIKAVTNSAPTPEPPSVN